MLNKILKRADVKEFLHEVLMNERFHNKKSPLTPEGTIYGKSEYSLMFMMDALIKYSILFESDDLIDEYIAQLKRFMKKCENHRDLVEGVIRILAKMTAVTLNIDIEQIEQPENKRKILSYIYNRYITNGYLFHSFPSSYIEQVKNEGIDSLKYSYNIENFAKTKKILRSHYKKEILTKDLENTSYITLTDSPALAFHYALHSPYYLAELVAITPYMDDDKKYNRGAYYQQDFKKAKENVEQLCRDLELSDNESSVLLETFIEEWKRLDITNSHPAIAFIKRESLHHNYLKDYRSILETCDREELIYSINKIMDSRIDVEKRYTPIMANDIKVVLLPGYREIFNNYEDFKEEKVVLEKEVVKEEMPARVNLRMEVVNTYGNASILALLGILFITLGATITILLAIYKG